MRYPDGKESADTGKAIDLNRKREHLYDPGGRTPTGSVLYVAQSR